MRCYKGLWCTGYKVQSGLCYWSTWVGEVMGWGLGGSASALQIRGFDLFWLLFYVFVLQFVYLIYIIIIKSVLVFLTTIHMKTFAAKTPEEKLKIFNYKLFYYTSISTFFIQYAQY